MLWAAVPRSTAITVLPELFPDSVRALAATGTDRAAGHEPRSPRCAGPAPRSARSTPAPAPARAAIRSSAELVLEGDAWRVGFAGRTVRVRDMKGIGDLVVLVEPAARRGPRARADGRHRCRRRGRARSSTTSPAGEYQARIVELQREIDEARADHDGARAERAELELDALVEQLSEAFGLGGRSRTTGSSAERARTAVTYRVRAAIRRITEVHPELGRHLTNAVRTGTWCSYRPESDVTWTIERRGLTV